MSIAQCKTCGGAGVVTVSASCQLCNGTGEVIVYEDDGTELMETCANCEFGLVYVEQKCEECDGVGSV